MPTLSSDLRNKLEKAIVSARNLAEKAAKSALEAMAVQHHEPYGHMTSEQRKLRNHLRARARQVGDIQDAKGILDIKHLAHECAYEHWHRMLFARFLAENNLLIEPDTGVAISLDECKELAKEAKTDLWTLAGRYAQRMLPQIFRADDPLLQVALAKEDQLKLEHMLDGLSSAVYTASDALGWCYQFWQTERKKQVNESGVKIGADELPAVTQLFTDDYMVDFLLDNTLGAWWAGKVLISNHKLAEKAKTEEELRKAVSLPGVEWKYLRFVKSEDGLWQPAAGTFEGWPKTAKELKCLDPCMGSGHFIVAMFDRLVALRIAEENLSEKVAVEAVIQNNLYGLEIDQRCTQLAAFNLALSAWKRVGHSALPTMHIACSGLAPNTKEADWLKIAEDNEKLRQGMKHLFNLFQKAPVLGSLINPRSLRGDLLTAEFHSLQPLLELALSSEDDEYLHEMTVAAQGITKAADILASEFTLVGTNVPYLGRSKQNVILMEYCERVYPEAKADLATCFIERCTQFCAEGGCASLVTPHGWLYLDRYKVLRKSTLQKRVWDFVARLGPRAFETISGEVVNVSLVGLTRTKPTQKTAFVGLDVSEEKGPSEKAIALSTTNSLLLNQYRQLSNPDARLVLGRSDEDSNSDELLSKYAECYQGLRTGDANRFIRCFWEPDEFERAWDFFQTSSNDDEGDLAGLSFAILWENGHGELARYAEETRDKLHDMHESGNRSWTKRGVAVGQMTIRPTWYFGDKFDNSLAVITPLDNRNLLALWTYCSSSQYRNNVREIAHGLYITNQALLKVPFNLKHWEKVAAKIYPHGLPRPHSDDPTQWLFNGYPQGSDQTLQVAVARLLGYQWPRQTGSHFPDCPALKPDGLEKLTDKDGIVCIPSVRGEEPAADRLRKLLATAYGKDWKQTSELELINATGSKASDLDEWLRSDFFDQHCDLFHQRPFVWHIWDGRKRDGFHALVNYHKLAAGGGKGRKTLEAVTHSYLNDWVSRQTDGVKRGEEGAEERLAAAMELKKRLKAIIEGEQPFDLFVRWKPISKQAIAWEPDINDGVRMNIRPFVASDLPNGKKGAGILRSKPKVKWDKDRGMEPERPKAEYPWFWNGGKFTGDRLNDVHLKIEQKQKARKS